SGGVSGSEGSVVLVAEGEKKSVEKAIEIVESIKGEKPLMPRKANCETCLPSSPAQSLEENVQAYGALDEAMPHCMFKGKKEEELPEYLRGR
ncbi:MAG: hypothetical protein ACE5LX_10525, partial [Nitrospinota bacterium]